MIRRPPRSTLFSCLLPRLRDDRRVSNGGMLEQQRFDLGRGNTEPLVLDHFFFAISDRHIPFFIAPANISPVEPSIPQRFGGCFRRLPVTFPPPSPPHPPFSLL